MLLPPAGSLLTLAAPHAMPGRVRLGLAQQADWVHVVAPGLQGILWAGLLTGPVGTNDLPLARGLLLPSPTR
eukprot:7735338-Pyramimonas_sp.AAC.1